MKRFVLTVFLILSELEVVFSQIPFAQVHNTPMLSSPSQAGSKQKLRLGIVRNKYSSDLKEYSNIYLSADLLMKKIGSGISLYYLRSSFDESGYLNRYSTGVYPFMERYFKTIDLSNTIGLSFAPKYNVYSKSGNNKIAFSLSPSLFIEGGIGSRHRTDLIFADRTSYSQDHPAGEQVLITEGLASAGIENTIWRYGAGLMLNSQQVMLLYKGSIESDKASEDTYILRFDIGDYNSRFNNSYTIYQTDHQVTVSLKFPKREESLMSFTPMAGLGFRAPLNVPSFIPPNRSSEFYSVYLREKKNSWHYRHLSMNFRIAKLLTGVSYTYADEKIYRGLNLGFQNNYLRISSSWSAPLKKTPSRHFFNEISLTVFL